MKYIGGGRVGGGWGGWEAEGGQHHPQGGKQQCYVLSRAQKLPQSTWQDETVVSSSLTPQAALLVPISGRQKTACESRPGYLAIAPSMVCLDSVRVWLSC